MDLTSRLRSIVRAGPSRAPRDPESTAPAGAPRIRELTYEPDVYGGAGESTKDLGRLGAMLGGLTQRTPFGDCLVIDRRYEADRRHGRVLVGDYDLGGFDGLRLLDPALRPGAGRRAVFIDLETTGLSGGAGTLAFLVGCGVFDLGAFHVRQFLLLSHAAERALLSAVADFVGDADLLVTYNGKTFDVPVMETRWTFHRMQMPLDGMPHFDMLHPARRLWRGRAEASASDGQGCRLTTLERSLFEVTRVGDVPGFEIPERFFRFLRSGDPRPLEPVLEHNRLDLVSLAVITAHAGRLAERGGEACRDASEALALGRIYERAGELSRAEDCYRRAAAADAADVCAEALYRLGLRYRRERRFGEAADAWRALLELTEQQTLLELTEQQTLLELTERRARPSPGLAALRQFAVEALAIHHEHRDRDLSTARELAQFALEEAQESSRAAGLRHRLARLDRKITRQQETFF